MDRRIIARRVVATAASPVQRPPTQPNLPLASPLAEGISSLTDRASPQTEAVPAKRARKTTKDQVPGPPDDWEEVLEKIEAYRKGHLAPVDTMGCERLGDKAGTPEVFRFQTLVSLMLSAQTKDHITAEAIGRLKDRIPGGLTALSMTKADPDLVHECINKVGFHNRKYKDIILAAATCMQKYDGDIPDSLEGLMALQGVGPKMAYLTLQCAWFRNEGIGVDTHVHRIANRLGWVNAKQPEGTRLALESWLPREKWATINATLVGFGQVLCLPTRPRCSEGCPVREQCPVGQGKKKA
ncbi:DNA glycosylase [Piptocephalis cylindrospora]|uniref:Endonuclease III homolog n=1 Tax=Piptocephalis cylindrospora TaxID=1907219 RepID=A0A4P9Y767_9FUNG|nr:DNA glycosylase [Piptocephalis cylindrospora]|eukprot:RKP14968.1 DNA glycosylase [Piptocephalis cylindrospora]